MQRITILGATGSIGVTTLDVVARHPDRYRVYALTAHSRVDELAEQCRALPPARRGRRIGQAAARAWRVLIARTGVDTEVAYGEAGLVRGRQRIRMSTR